MTTGAIMDQCISIFIDTVLIPILGHYPVGNLPRLMKSPMLRPILVVEVKCLADNIGPNLSAVLVCIRQC